jgi:hypothetical protein
MRKRIRSPAGSISTVLFLRWLGKRRNQRREHLGRVLAGIEPIFKFFGIFMQMLFGNVYMSGTDAALQMFPEIFQAVHMRTIQDVFLLVVVNYFVIIALLCQTAIAHKLIRMRRGTFLDILLNDGMEGFLFAVRNDFGHYLSAAFKHTKHNRFVLCATSTTHAVRFSANISLVNFDITKQRKFAVHIFHVLANQMSHAPRRFICYAKLPFQFLGRNAVTGSGEQVNGIKPQLQRSAAILERSAHSGMQVMAAPLTGIGTFGLKAKPFGRLAAFWANMALSKADLEQMCKALFIIRELREKLTDGDTGFDIFNFRRRFHASNIAEMTTYVKGINPSFFSENGLERLGIPWNALIGLDDALAEWSWSAVA